MTNRQCHEEHTRECHNEKRNECHDEFTTECRKVPITRQVSRTELECSCPKCTKNAYGHETCHNGEKKSFRSGCHKEVCESHERYETVHDTEEKCEKVAHKKCEDVSHEVCENKPHQVCQNVVTKKIEQVPRTHCDTVQKKVCY